jgi:hypothetical protein
MKNIVPCHPVDPSLLLSRQDPTDDLRLVGMRGCKQSSLEFHTFDSRSINIVCLFCHFHTISLKNALAALTVGKLSGALV